MVDHPPIAGAGPPEPPPSVRTSVTLVWTIVGLSVLSAVLTYVFIDELVAATSQQQTGVDADAARTGVVVGTVFGLLIFGALWVMLAVFLRRGANWARIVLTVFAAMGVLFGAIGLVSSEQPIALTVTSLLTIVLQAALLYCMWQAESSAYIRARRGS